MVIPPQWLRMKKHVGCPTLLVTFAKSSGFFLSFVLLFCVMLSMPISRSIYLFQLDFNVGLKPVTDVDVNVRFGLWGFCGTGGDVEVLSQDIGHRSTQCTRPRFGYDLDSPLVNALHLGGIAKLVSNVLSSVMIFHFIMFLATLVTLGSSPFAYMMWHKINKSTSLEVWMRVTHAASILVGSMVGLIALFCDTAPIHLLDAALEGFSLGTFTLTTGDGVTLAKCAIIFHWVNTLYVIWTSHLIASFFSRSSSPPKPEPIPLGTLRHRDAEETSEQRPHPGEDPSG